MTTAIIPARAGSKGLPLKNLRTVGGVSLLGRAIQTARRAVPDVLVSTEDQRIADEAERHGARVHRRPSELATDTSEPEDVLRDALRSTDAETIILVQCTAPLMTAGDVARCRASLAGHDVAVAVHEFDGTLLGADYQPLLHRTGRRQDRRQFVLAGSCWAFRRSHLNHDCLLAGRIGVVVADAPLRLDIDTESDLRLAEWLIRGEWSVAVPEIKAG